MQLHQWGLLHFIYNYFGSMRFPGMGGWFILFLITNILERTILIQAKADSDLKFFIRSFLLSYSFEVFDIFQVQNLLFFQWPFHTDQRKIARNPFNDCSKTLAMLKIRTRSNLFNLTFLWFGQFVFKNTKKGQCDAFLLLF